MANEILMLRARLSAKKEEFKQLELKAENYIISIRETLDPYEDDFTNLEIERAQQAMQDFYILWREARKLKEQIEKMDRNLKYV